MKKILLILGEFNTGGGERMVYELAKNIDREKFKIEILCTGHAIHTLLEEEVCKYFDVKFANIDRFNVRSMIKISRIINKINPDVIHAHLGGVTFAAPFAVIYRKTKLVITVHTRPDKAFANKVIEFFVRWLTRKRQKNTLIVAVSKKNCDDMKKWLNGGSDLCVYVNNGVDLDRYNCRIAHDVFTFINVASHNENKNQISIIKAFQKIVEEGTNAKLILVGDGPTHSELIEYTKKNQLEEKIIFTGIVDDVYHYTAESDVFVQASFREALPLSIIEAMAASLGIVATNVGGLKDIVEDNGILVPSGDDEALVNAMREFCEYSSEELERKKQQSFLLSKKFSAEEMGIHYMKLYEKLCE